MKITHVLLGSAKHMLRTQTQGPRTAPRALREQVWIRYNGETFEAKCVVDWCQTKLTVFTFEAGHNVPYSKGGKTSIDNLRPICSACNRGMGNTHTIDEWSKQLV